MTERVKGLSLEAAGQIRNTEIAKELSLPPVKWVQVNLCPGYSLNSLARRAQTTLLNAGRGCDQSSYP